MSAGGDPKKSIDYALKRFLAPNSFGKQILGGTASGLVSGVVVGSAGKGISLVLGTGIILYQIAHHQGYVKTDLYSLKELAKQKTTELSKTNTTVSKMRTLATKNKTFTAGFLGGFLLGIAF